MTGSSEMKKEKKNPHAFGFTMKQNPLSHIRIFGTSIFEIFLESMCHDTKDATESKVDFISAVTQLSV